MKNIVIVNDYDYVQGGASKVAIDTAKALYEKNYHVIFFSGVHSTKEYQKIGYQNVSLNMRECLKDKNKIRGAIRGIYNRKAKKELGKLLDTLDPKETIIHIHSWTKSLSCSVFSVAFKKKFKVVLTLHDYFTACPNGGFFNYQKNQICHLKPLSGKCICTHCDSRNYPFKLYRIMRSFVQNKIVKLNKRIDHIIYISELQWRILKDNFRKDVDARKILNPIETKTTKKIKDHTKNDYFLYAGRIALEKGVDIFCEACKILKVRGVIVGSGDLEETYKENYPFMEFMGWQSKEKVEEYMLKAKALVFPSLLYEGAPLTIEEALTLHLPCIVGDTSSATEKIQEGKNGFIYHTKDAKDLAEKMKKIDSLKFQDILESNTFESYIEELTRYYQSII